MTPAIAIILVTAAALLAAAVTYFMLRDSYKRQIADYGKRLSLAREDLLQAKDEAQKALSREKEEHRQALQQVREDSEKALQQAREDGANALSQAKDEHRQALQQAREDSEKALQRQIESVKAQIAAESEKVLKERQEEFSKHARESFSTIAGDFNKNLQDMKKSFEDNRNSQTQTSAELKAHLEDAVKHLSDQTKDIGDKADHLASALRGQNKMQGCWGETQLGNILSNEGLVQGRDYDREETLRDSMGIIVRNEDTGRKMRPDFILHYPDNTDIVVDCKVSLVALSDYMSAEDRQAKDDAAQRNLKAINEQVDSLSRKDYGSYLLPGHKFLDYTVMFVPNVNALTLARQIDPMFIAKAYRKGVLITSEETFIPFLSLVRTAWVNFEQAKGQEKIIACAQRMVDRVADFCDAYAAMGRKLDEARKCYEKGSSKIAENGQSILRAAHDVIALGVKSKKKLPDPGTFAALEGPEDQSGDSEG